MHCQTRASRPIECHLTLCIEALIVLEETTVSKIRSALCIEVGATTFSSGIGGVLCIGVHRTTKFVDLNTQRGQTIGCERVYWRKLLVLI